MSASFPQPFWRYLKKSEGWMNPPPHATNRVNSIGKAALTQQRRAYSSRLNILEGIANFRHLLPLIARGIKGPQSKAREPITAVRRAHRQAKARTKPHHMISL